MPQHGSILVPILGHLLLLHEKDPALALTVLTRALDFQASADVEADLVQCWLALGRIDAARRRLVWALSYFAVAPSSNLAEAARSLMSSTMSVTGFVLLTPGLELYAEARTQAAGLFELKAADGRVLVRTEATASDRKACALKVPAVFQPQFVVVTLNGNPLLGGERILPVDFRVEGRTTAAGSRIEGWARLGWNPDAPVDLEISDEAGQCQRVRALCRGPESQWHYSFSARDAGLGNRLRIEVLLPDGTRSELTDSPLLLKPELDEQLHRVTPRMRRRAAPVGASPIVESLPAPVDVIIPVYEGRDETLACIDAVLRTTHGVAARLLVVDDASPDAALAADLDELAEQGQIWLLRNPENLGFGASVNRAMALSVGHDAVLLNADTVVFGDWLQRLRQAAYSAANIGSATPFSDDDSVVQCCKPGAVDMPLAEALDQFAATAYCRVTEELPVGVGFCLYVRRDCWNQTGSFDVSVFGKGYGEESDWCMRARKRGWLHLLAADVLVHHAGGRSFGGRRLALQERADRLMNLRHPGYASHVGRFLQHDPLHRFRRGFDAYRLSAQNRPIVLLLMLGLPGGVDRFVGERCRILREQGKLPLLLRPLNLEPDACTLWSLDPRITQLRFAIPEELIALQELLKALPIESVELHHFLGLDARLVQTVLDLGLPFEAYLHDYSWICPRITLMDETDRYCGEPDLRSCERCAQRNTSDLKEKTSVAALRGRSKQWLHAASRVIAPSRDTAVRYRRYFPDLEIKVEALESAPIVYQPSRARQAGRVRVALIGAIGEHKGFAVLFDCVRDAISRKLDLEFVVIGHTCDDAALLETGKVFVTGEYIDDEVPGLIRREQPDVIWLPCVWPETWCYTLTHAMSSGLPVVAFDIGAVAERLRQQGMEQLLQLDSSALEINDRLLQSART